MLRSAKLATLKLLKASGSFRLVGSSRWRRERLLILCYHGISLEDEHLWRPQLYMTAESLGRRLTLLQAMKCSVLPLGEGLARLQNRDLPPRSVAITFDDGTADFYKQAWPLLQKYGFPATIYQTTYYVDRQVPVFNLVCSYLLWKRRGERVGVPRELGLTEEMDLRSEAGRHRVVRALVELSQRESLTGMQRNEIARRLAGALGIDYESLAAKRILHLMNAREIAEVSRDGADVELHTHRHRTPDDEMPFRKEIAGNRERLAAITGKPATHFCYPGGVYRKEFPDWLKKENVVSATTCDAGLADRNSSPFLLPRLVDTSIRTELEFESWISGVGSLLAVHKTAGQRYVPQEE
ncbi:MAG TPA: polysaccharide deacetylase family protein [Candidatus Sulfotelmatobacter sp.]|jgi:peptidoglycan/xylan/chitin deacetylase (PgdA/CDA1 family)